MTKVAFRLRNMSVSLRIAATCLILVLGGGYLAAVQHMFDHYENKDERPGLTMDDITGSFHGVNREATLIGALDGHMREHVTEGELAKLMAWLEGNSISADYDNLELGDMAPAEIIDRSCLRCHSRNASEGDGIGATVPLDYWDDVKLLAFSKQLDPVPLEILTVSTHTHALSMAVVTVVSALLFLATAWPCRVRHGLVMLTFIALLVDLGSWWLARWFEPFVLVLVIAGGIYGALLSLQLLGAFVDMWFGRIVKDEAHTP